MRIDKDTSVLLLADIQVDFLPGGALPTYAGDAILAPVRALMEADQFRHLVAVQDWHPPGHISFASSHPGRRIEEVIELYGQPQVLWPDHCVQATPGAELHPALPWQKVRAIIRKGNDPEVDTYSAFRHNWDAAGQRPTTGLAGYLRELEIKTVVICGLTRDFCVKWSAEDAVDAGFETCVLWDLTRPVEPDSDARVRNDLVRKGVEIIDARQLVA